MARPLITLLTDFGTADHYVGAMKGVMAGICPGAQFVDITHEVPAYDIGHAAWTLSQAWPCFPKGTVHLIVVDPGVGGKRRPIVAEAGGQRFVAPDNGVLTRVLAADPRHKVREITANKYFRSPVSRTFHGRDIFAPVAAHIARGVSLASFGKRITDPVLFALTKPHVKPDGSLDGKIQHIDGFGNLVTNFDAAVAKGSAGSHRLQVGRAVVKDFADSYAGMPANKPFAIIGSSGFLEISINQGNAAETLGISRGDRVTLRPR